MEPPQESGFLAEPHALTQGLVLFKMDRSIQGGLALQTGPG